MLRGDSGVRTVQVTPAAQTAWNLGDLGVGPVVFPQVLDMLSTTSSAAQEAGIQIGDIIEAIDGREVTQAELIETVNASPDIALTMRIRRDGVQRDKVPEFHRSLQSGGLPRCPAFRQQECMPPA